MKALAKPVLSAAGVAAALLLSACDSGDSITPADPPLPSSPAEAPDLLDGFAEVCQATFVEQGGAAELAEEFCDCSNSRIVDQDLGPADLVNEETMNAIGAACMDEVLDAQEGASG